MNREIAFGFIFARGGSKGVLGKNKRMLAGKPLVAHAIETALACPSISRVIVSSDDPDIIKIAKEYGAEAPFVRPQELSGDKSAEWDAWKHVIEYLRSENNGQDVFDIFVSVPAVCPLRNVQDVENAISYYQKSEFDLVVTAEETTHNPYYTLVNIGDDGQAHKFAGDHLEVFQRQKAPKVLGLVSGAFVTSPQHVLVAHGVFDGRVGVVEIPRARAIDIDNELDFEIADLLLSKNNKDAVGG